MPFIYEKQDASKLLPQDWAGYEGEWPDPKWPGGAKIAVTFMIHAEAGAERHQVNGDPYPEAWLTENNFSGYGSLPHRGGVSASTVYEYETCRAFWNLLDVFDRYSLPATVSICGRAAEVFKPFVTESESRNYEIITEGYRFIDYFGEDPKTEDEHIRKSITAIKEAGKGTIVKSYYMARPTHLTEDIVRKAFKEETGEELSYSNCFYGDDLPYWGPSGLLYVPMSLDCNDQKFVSSPGFSSGVDFYDHVVGAFDALYSEGIEGSPKMMTIALHPRLIARPGRLAYLIKVIEHIQQHDGVWFAKRQEVADHWKKVHPKK
ncbi:hypothetical protein M231_07570 [Tremella mesenterica]|uniref:NodB homology domain-containing protein n=1 Tax=Tremella mesenterica TaxID=5217 RepID=A0A4Q1B8S0_TREME|nr:hypothetical protein M231_07570 [Tremella mesenterica]